VYILLDCARSSAHVELMVDRFLSAPYSVVRGIRISHITALILNPHEERAPSSLGNLLNGL
jgi:hypothetical protein